jgi:hypothetical protein
VLDTNMTLTKREKIGTVLKIPMVVIRCLRNRRSKLYCPCCDIFYVTMGLRVQCVLRLGDIGLIVGRLAIHDMGFHRAAVLVFLTI